ALLGASKVKVDNNNAHYFLKNSDIRVSTHTMNKKASGSSVINLLISSTQSDGEPFKDPANLSHVDDLVRFLETHPKVGKVLSLTELIKRINLVLHDENEAFNVVPGKGMADTNAQNMISQLLLLYENGGGDALSDFTDTGYQNLNLTVILKTTSSLEMFNFKRKVNAFVTQNFPKHLSLCVSGSANVAVAATDEIVQGQMISLMVSMTVVFIMLLATFRALSHATIAMVPLAMTIAVNFGIMGFFNIPLDIGTAIISSIVIGIGVDYSIHYISRLKQNLERGMDFSDALNNTVRHSGKAIMSNAVTVGLGFIALLFSILTPLIIMGWMITVTMVVSSLCTLILIPVLFVFVEKPLSNTAEEKKWLTLNPGPQR
ncbi:MAG: MMPL family transporter, partial [Desulfobacteraceae bacterium]|nr:MMPL family transporter [Desulfobacteraceae bacterium]